mmetsp:Transcript_30861/g.99563  ORF Transcript_30861/g.99563 Transcript_30861/m.99563 type:complete len:377 (+) Transcript_30861:60-1190(+)
MLSRTTSVLALSLRRGSALVASGGVAMMSLAAPKKEDTNLRVVSYNVLSSGLCEPSYYVKSAAEDLAPETRLERVTKYLELETYQESVICLQEVSRDWAGPLQVFFAKRNYHFAASLYGHQHNNYMGVAMAWPSTMEVQAIEHRRVAEGFDYVAPKGNGGDYDSSSDLASRLWLALFPPPPKPFDVWGEAARRHNVVLMARFRDFAVATYHMPCLFGSVEKEQVMILHAAKTAELVQKFADGKPFVFAGDFNIKPQDEAYAMLTDGAFAKPEYCPPNFDVASCPRLVSAYAKASAGEPELTNFAFTKFSTEPFVDTLDYIFLSGGSDHWAVDDVKQTPSKAHLDLQNSSFPDRTQPSDHVPIAADLRLLSSSLPPS